MIELTSADFAQTKMVAKWCDRKMMIRCYLPTCGRCKATEAVYASLDKVAGSKFYIAQADCSKYLMNVFTLGVKSTRVPVFAIVVGGVFKSLYTGSIDVNEMLKAMDAAR